jgi:hemolysin III
MLLADDGRPAGVNWNYTRREMLADGTIHVLGVVLGVAGAIGIVVIAALSPISWVERAGVAIYAAGLVSMLGVSATYNMWPVGRRKWLLRRFDHALIYLMIAGTYTPLVALVGDGVPAWGLLGTVWLVAGIGIALKLILPGRYDRAAIGLYLTLGWSGVVAYDAVPPMPSGSWRPVVCCIPSGSSSTSGGACPTRTRSGTPSCSPRPPAITAPCSSRSCAPRPEPRTGRARARPPETPAHLPVQRPRSARVLCSRGSQSVDRNEAHSAVVP